MARFDDTGEEPWDRPAELVPASLLARSWGRTAWRRRGRAGASHLSGGAGAAPPRPADRPARQKPQSALSPLRIAHDPWSAAWRSAQWRRGRAVAFGHVRAFPPSAPALLSRRPRLEREVPGQGPEPARRHVLPRPRGRGRPAGEGGRPGRRWSRPSREQDWGDAVVCVRVNAWDTRWTYGDVIEVVGQAGPPARRGHAAEGAERRRGGGPGPAAHPGGDQLAGSPPATSESKPRSRRLGA